MSEIVLVHVTFASLTDAERIGETLVAERLAACVNIADACRSIYRWHEDVQRGTEVPATFKTAPVCARRLVERLTALHGYDLPVVEQTRVEVDEAVARWVAKATA